MSDHRRNDLRETFDTIADRYHRARPRYPQALFDDLQALSGCLAPVDVLEVGPASGIATEVLADAGHRITAIELGAELARAAAHNLAAFNQVSVVHGSFESWDPPAWGGFDLVVAATAWHWLDPATRYERAHRHLRGGGALAIWSANHVVPDGGDSFFADLQPVYDRIGESMPSGSAFPRPGELPDLSTDIEGSGLFEMVAVRDHDWEVTYTADTYIDLLDTFSGHIAMGPAKREVLDSEIRSRLADRPDGLLRRHWGARLHVARSLD